MHITRDESRHLSGTLSMLENLASRMPKEKRLMITRQMKHGFIYLSPLLFEPLADFWKLPSDFIEWDRKLEEKAYECGLGTPAIEEKTKNWREAILKQSVRLEEIGIQVPAIKEIGLDGVDIPRG